MFFVYEHNVEGKVRELGLHAKTLGTALHAILIKIMKTQPLEELGGNP
jgi:hypothetical protein